MGWGAYLKKTCGTMYFKLNKKAIGSCLML
jgi:hypothetical protein